MNTLPVVEIITPQKDQTLCVNENGQLIDDAIYFATSHKDSDYEIQMKLTRYNQEPITFSTSQSSIYGNLFVSSTQSGSFNEVDFSQSQEAEIEVYYEKDSDAENNHEDVAEDLFEEKGSSNYQKLIRNIINLKKC